MLFHSFLVLSLFRIVSAKQKPFWIEHESPSPNSEHELFTEPNDIVTAYAGITTFAHLPFINCLNPVYEEEAREKFDIAIVGAPFDTTVTYRPG